MLHCTLWYRQRMFEVVLQSFCPPPIGVLGVKLGDLRGNQSNWITSCE